MRRPGAPPSTSGGGGGRLLLLPLLLATAGLLPSSTEARGCQIRNFAGEPVNFYWMDVANWGNYIQQTKHPLLPESSAPIKTFEGHRFFAAFARQADQVLKWDPDTIPLHAQFVHRGFDQVVTAKVNVTTGALFLDDWDIHEGEMNKLARIVEACGAAHAGDDGRAAHARCIQEQAGASVQRLEAEKDFIAQQTVNMRERMRQGFCTTKAKSAPVRAFDAKSASLPIAEAGTGRLKRRKLHVEVLAEDARVGVYHLKGFLDSNMTAALLLNGPLPGGDGGERHAAVAPAVGFTPDAALVEIAKWAADFVAAELDGAVEAGQDLPKERRPSVVLGPEAVVGGEPLHFFRHDDNGIHAPPCDGHCPLLGRPVSEYAATLIMYPKAAHADAPKKKKKKASGEKNERPPATGPLAWKVALPGGEEARFVSAGNDAVLLLYKAAGGLGHYAPELLPRLVPCPVVEDTLTVTRWIPRLAVSAPEGGGSSAAHGHEEL